MAARKNCWLVSSMSTMCSGDFLLLFVAVVRWTAECCDVAVQREKLGLNCELWTFVVDKWCAS